MRSINDLPVSLGLSHTFLTGQQFLHFLLRHRLKQGAFEHSAPFYSFQHPCSTSKTVSFDSLLLCF